MAFDIVRERVCAQPCKRSLSQDSISLTASRQPKPLLCGEGTRDGLREHRGKGGQRHHGVGGRAGWTVLGRLGMRSLRCKADSDGQGFSHEEWRRARRTNVTAISTVPR